MRKKRAGVPRHARCLCHLTCLRFISYRASECARSHWFLSGALHIVNLVAPRLYPSLIPVSNVPFKCILHVRNVGQASAISRMKLDGQL